MSNRRRNISLWTVQVLLAALFLFAGVMKLIMPIAAMEGPVYLPGLFLRFIGVAEVAGALGLVLPGLFRVQRALTPIAAICLVCVMAGATSITLQGGAGAGAAIPGIVGVLAAIVAFGRREWSGALV